MKHLYTFFFILCFSIITQAQQSKIDSLKQYLSIAKSDSDKLKIYQELFSTVTTNDSFHELDSLFIQKMNNLAKEMNSNDVEIKSYMLFISYFMKEENFKLAENYSNLAQFNIENLKNLDLYYKVQNLRGRMYHHFMKYNSAIKIYQKAIHKFQTEPEGNIIFDFYSNLASSYRNSKQTNKESDALLKAIEYADSINDKENQAYSNYSLAWTYMNRTNYGKAIEYFKSGIKIIEEEKILKYTYFHRGLGLAYSRSGEYNLALKHNFLALSFFQETKNIRFEFDTLNNIAVVYNRMNNPEKGEEYAKKALAIANIINHPLAISASLYTLSVSQKDLEKYLEAEKTFILLAKDTLTSKKNDLNFKTSLYSNFADIYFYTGRYKKSSKYYLKQIILMDSLHKENIKSKFSDIETKYQTEKKEKENLQLKAENVEQELLTQKANTRNWLLLFGILTSLISTFFIWRRYKSEAKAKQIISEQKTQIEKLQKEFHHRIKNDFRSINSFIRLAQKKFPETEFQERLNELKNRVTSMFKVHELLLEQDDITKVKAKPYLVELSENVKQKYDSNNITLNCNIDEEEVIVADKSVPFGVILNEFVTNSYKHAFDENGGNISINFHSDAYNHYLTLKDNGKGLPSDFDKHNLRSFGLEIMPLLAEQYDGEFKLENDNGVFVTVSLPKQIA